MEVCGLYQLFPPVHPPPTFSVRVTVNDGGESEDHARVDHISRGRDREVDSIALNR